MFSRHFGIGSLKARTTPILIDEPQPPKVKKVNQYLLASKIGHGSSAKVYLAIDNQTNKQYAAKCVHIGHDHQLAVSLQREIQTLRTLDHPNILKLYEVLHVPDSNVAYLILEYGDCGSLQTSIEKNYIIDERQIANIFYQVVLGLSYLHSQGIVHQDIKPSNILITSSGKVKLSDFGIGHHFESAEEVIGSPAYQAPEFFNDDIAEIDPIKEDIWSLGVTLYETVFKKLPFNGNTIYEIANNIRNNPLILPASISPDLKDLLLKMLTPNPKDRVSLKGILEHPFFITAAPNIKIPPQIPKMRQSCSFDNIIATVCDENYTFDTFTRATSWCGLYRQ